MNAHITLPELFRGKIVYKPWMADTFDEVIADWNNQERKDRDRKRRAGWAVVGEILKQRQVMLAEIEPALKTAETNRRKNARGQTSLM